MNTCCSLLFKKELVLQKERKKNLSRTKFRALPPGYQMVRPLHLPHKKVAEGAVIKRLHSNISQVAI